MALVKLNNNGVKNATAFGSITGLGDLTFISRSTASSSATVSITSGITSTYKEYIFVFNNIHPATNAAKFSLIGSTDGGSNYGVATTTSMIEALVDESGNSGEVRYEDGDDVAQSTSAFPISTGIGSDNDESLSGFLHLFEPSSTTFVKHFLSTIQSANGSGTPFCVSNRTSGYFNTTSAITAIQFSFNSGNIDSGTIDMYGVN